MTENKRKVTQLEKQMTSGYPEITRWTTLELYAGRYYRGKKPLTDQEYRELASQSGLGIFVIRLTDAKKAED